MQRTAVIVGVKGLRKAAFDQPASVLQEAMSAVVFQARLNDTDLSNYSESHTAQLSKVGLATNLKLEERAPHAE
jgi:hypothetical protein